MTACPACREHNPDRARFCSGCGSRLTGHPVEVRTMVSLAVRPQVPGRTEQGPLVEGARGGA